MYLLLHLDACITTPPGWDGFTPAVCSQYPLISSLCQRTTEHDTEIPQAASHITSTSTSCQVNRQGPGHKSSVDSAKQAVTQRTETKDSESAFSPDLCVICLHIFQKHLAIFCSYDRVGMGLFLCDVTNCFACMFTKTYRKRVQRFILAKKYLGLCAL